MSGNLGKETLVDAGLAGGWQRVRRWTRVWLRYQKEPCQYSP